MQFSEILKALEKPLSLGKNRAQRVRTLADLVTVDVDHHQDFYAALGNAPTLNKYASGSKLSPSFAQAILGGEHGYYDPDGLIAKIERLAEPLRDALADRLQTFIPSVTADNVAEMVSAELTETLAHAVDDDPLATAAREAQQEAAAKAFQRRAMPILLQQAGDSCAMPGCANALFTTNDVAERKLPTRPVVIDPSKDHGTLSNLAVLCASCQQTYTGTNRVAVKALLSSKRLLEDRQAAHALLVPTNLEGPIRDLVEKVAALALDEPGPQTWVAHEVRRKIPSSPALVQKVEGYVAAYYNYIKSVSKDLSEEGTLNFRRIQRTFGERYDDLATLGQSEAQTFDAMVDWLLTTTGSDRSPCEALVSYFVQICEVFHANP